MNIFIGVKWKMKEIYWALRVKTWKRQKKIWCEKIFQWGKTGEKERFTIKNWRNNNNQIHRAEGERRTSYKNRNKIKQTNKQRAFQFIVENVMVRIWFTMSEPKRVTFETISTGSSKNSSSGASTKDDKTVRLKLKLFEPNADSFPQFNFKKLCRAEKVMDNILGSKQISVCVVVSSAVVQQKIIVPSIIWWKQEEEEVNGIHIQVCHLQITVYGLLWNGFLFPL